MVGTDVASAHVDVRTTGAELPTALSHVGDDADGHSALADGLARLKPELVLMEATGGYEAALACALQAVALRVAVGKTQTRANDRGSAGSQRVERSLVRDPAVAWGSLSSRRMGDAFQAQPTLRCRASHPRPRSHSPALAVSRGWASPRAGLPRVRRRKA
jgi:hypothetical protein